MPKLKKKSTSTSKNVVKKKISNKIKVSKPLKSLKNTELSPVLRAFFVGIFIVLTTVLIPAIYPSVELFITKKFLINTTVGDINNPVFIGLNKDTVDSITIKTVQETFTIQKTTRNWVIDGKEVSKNRIDTLFKSIRSFNLGTLLSKNPKNHLELGISDLLGSFVTIRSGSREVNFVIGNPSSVLNSFYFRFLGSNEVYLSSGDLREIITIRKNDWLED